MVRFFVILLLFCSCKAKRCDRFATKHPECFGVVSDTIYDTTTYSALDTVLLPTGDADTFYISNDIVKVRIIRQHDTIRATIDSIQYVTKTITTTKTVKVKERQKWWLWLILLGAIFLTVKFTQR